MPKRTNEEWLSDLSTPGPGQEDALDELRKIIHKGLPYALSKYLTADDPHLDALIEEVTQDTLLRVLSRLESFEGRSQFTTWVHKIAIRIALTELRRRKWRDVSLESMIEDQPFSAGVLVMEDKKISPETAAEQAEMIEHIQRIISEELTEKQRQALVAISIQGMPLEEVARRMNTSRNALYKLMHDARLRLKKKLTQEGLSAQDVLSMFGEQ